MNNFCKIMSFIIFFCMINSALAFDPCNDQFNQQGLTPIQSHSLLSKIINNCPQNQEALLQIGFMFEQEGNLEEAENVYNRVVTGPDLSYSLMAQTGLASIARQSGDIRKAQEANEALGVMIEKAKNLKSFSNMSALNKAENTYTKLRHNILDRMKQNRGTVNTLQPYNNTRGFSNKYSDKTDIGTVAVDDKSDVGFGGVNFK
ncbi:MAG: tetratricopeptide repeat protein [Magnetococcus sp. DMHC-6]